jgi:energy-converting hydrogenase Eha subunit C
MNIFGWIQVVLGLLAIGSGAMVLRGVLRVKLSGSRVITFLRFSLIASLAGLLPLTGHLSPIQRICMLSVYCSGTIILAWRKFHLAGLWRPVFAFSIVAVLYLNVASVSTLLFNHSPLFAIEVTGPGSLFRIVQFFLASAFALLGVLAVRMCHAQRTNSF